MDFYTDAQRAMQQEFGTEPLADAIAAAIVVDELGDRHIPFIESRDFFFLSTVTADGEPTVSYKGGDVGTVKVVDPKTLAFPFYDGNGMFLSLGNIAESAKIGMLFIDFETPNRVRVQATAALDRSGDFDDHFPGAIAIVRATIDQVFVNCARYIHTHTRVEQSPYVPDEQGHQPFATWKRIDGIQPFLPEKDRGGAEAAGGTITDTEYAAALEAGES